MLSKVKHIKRPPTLITLVYSPCVCSFSISGKCYLIEVILSVWAAGIGFLAYANQMDLGRKTLFRPYMDATQESNIYSWHSSCSPHFFMHILSTATCFTWIIAEMYIKITDLNIQLFLIKLYW